MTWTTRKEHHKHMKLRQEQNRAKCIQSKAEAWMKKQLEDTGYRWTQQAQWGFRLFDFWCPYIGIAVEVDGPEHNAAEDGASDQIEYQRSGILVLRVRNFNEREARYVLGIIDHACPWNDRRERLGLDPIKNTYDLFKK